MEWPESVVSLLDDDVVGTTSSRASASSSASANAMLATLPAQDHCYSVVAYSFCKASGDFLERVNDIVSSVPDI